MKKDDLTKDMTGLFVKGGLVLLVLLLAMSAIVSLMTGSSMFSPTNWSAIKSIFIISLIVFLMLFMAIMIMTVFVTKSTPAVSKSAIYKDNTLRYEEYDEKGRKHRKTFSITNIDAYLDKYKQMFIIDDIVLGKKNGSEKSNINTLLLKMPDGQEMSLNQLNSSDPKEYIRICSFLNDICNYDEQELYWRLGSTVSKENLILDGRELINDLKKTASVLNDEQINEMIDETIASINTLDENIGKYSSRNRIRKIYDHYLPLLIKIMNNYNTIDFIEDTERKTGARKELVDTINLINTALSSLTDSSEEDSQDALEAEVSEAEKLLEKVEKKA